MRMKEPVFIVIQRLGMDMPELSGIMELDDVDQWIEKKGVDTNMIKKENIDGGNPGI